MAMAVGQLLLLLVLVLVCNAMARFARGYLRRIRHLRCFSFILSSKSSDARTERVSKKAAKYTLSATTRLI